MDEEFQESDVVFSDHHHDNNGYFTYQELVMSTTTQGGHGARNSGKHCKKKKKKSSPGSLPMNINIPDNLFQYLDKDDFKEEYQDGEIIPPHVIVARRFFAGKMAFSVCTGNGRTLKGRDLSQVRNSILRMTGFLET